MQKTLIIVVVLAIIALGAFWAVGGFSENGVSFESNGEESEDMVINVYFGNSEMSPEDCYKVYPVERTVSSTEAIGTVAVNKLLEGPTEEEKSEGYFTSLPEGVLLNSLRVEESVAYADFNEALNEGGGSCMMASRAAQISETLEQFPTVDEVIISVNGDAETALQP